MAEKSVRTIALASEEQVPALGQGTWELGEHPARRKDEIAALRLGLDLGMTLIDTAEMYGNGASNSADGLLSDRTGPSALAPRAPSDRKAPPGHTGTEGFTMSDRPTHERPAAEDWAGEMGQRWLANADQFEGMLAPIGAALLKHAGFRPGERVVDIGCGAGQTSIDIAHTVVPGGSVLGIDISRHLIEGASRRARTENTRNVSFQCADAATVFVESPPFDRLFSRFGLMFFADAYAAFANLHTLVRQGGRADFSVWAPASENPWIVQVTGIIGRHVEIPATPPRAPGPFALDDPDYVRELLSEAGFGTPDFETWQGNQPVGGPGASPREATVFVLETMGFGQVLEKSAPDARTKVTSELEALFARNHTDKGVEMAGKAYFVSAVA